MFALLTACFISVICFSQNINKIINASEVSRIENVLASDSMLGRRTFTPSIDKAADFIADEFKKSGLKYFDGLTSYKQPFSMKKTTIVSASGNINGNAVDAGNIIAVTTDADLDFDENSGFIKVIIRDTSNFFREAFGLLKSHQKYLVLVDTSHANNFQRLKRFNRESFDDKAPVVFVLLTSGVVPCVFFSPGRAQDRDRTLPSRLLQWPPGML